MIADLDENFEYGIDKYFYKRTTLNKCYFDGKVFFSVRIRNIVRKKKFSDFNVIF